jgi:peptidoglycan/LPS O-acetylase OafA/YrhL
MKKFLHSINWFRGVAILFVVLTHMPTTGLLDHHNFQYWQSFVQNGTAFFIFIAGYLYWHLIDRFHYKQYLLSKIKNVITPYLLIMTVTISLIYLLSIFGINSIDYAKNADYKVQFTQPFLENGFLWHYLKGGAINFPLWFIPMISVFFIFSSVIKKIGDSRFFFCFLFFFLLITFTTERGGWAPHQFIHYLGVWLFGVFCKKNEAFIYKNATYISLLSFIPSLLFVYFKANGDGGLINYSEVQKFFSTLFLLSSLMLLESKGIKIKALDILAKYSFGIFFIHFYFLIILNILFFRILDLAPMELYFCTFIFTTLGSLFSCWFVKRYLPNYSRTLLGI